MAAPPLPPLPPPHTLPDTLSQCLGPFLGPCLGDPLPTGTEGTFWILELAVRHHHAPSTDGRPLSDTLIQQGKGAGSGRPATFQCLKRAGVLPSARHGLPFSFRVRFQEWILISKALLSWGTACSENQSLGSVVRSLAGSVSQLGILTEWKAGTEDTEPWPQGLSEPQTL